MSFRKGKKEINTDRDWESKLPQVAVFRRRLPCVYLKRSHSLTISLLIHLSIIPLLPPASSLYLFTQTAAAFIYYRRHFATPLQSVCLCMKWLRNTSTEAAGGLGRTWGLSIIQAGKFFKVAWLQCVWKLCLTWIITATINPSTLLYHSSTYIWYIYSFVSPSLTCMALSFIFPIHQFAHSSIYLLIHPLIE